MSVIHRTTLTPTKTELLTAWLPRQPWYAGNAGGSGDAGATRGAPVLARAGGFRLDDPEGEVGIEFMVVLDTSGGEPVAYHVPLTYRGAPLDGGAAGLLGTAEHGVLGTRWVYDAAHDPVCVAQLLALLQGRAVPQAQQVSNAADPSVTVRTSAAGLPDSVVAPAGAGAEPVAAGPDGTRIVLVEADGGAVAGADGAGSGGRPVLDVRRVLRPEGRDGHGAGPAGDADTGAGAGAGTCRVVAGWQLPDGTEHRGVFAALHRMPG